MIRGVKMAEEKYVKGYYQGIYLTETILGNPNGDFVDNMPRNFDGNVFTTDKCIKYNIRKYLHDFVEDLEKKENIVFFYPRLAKNTKLEDNKFISRNDAFKELFNKNFENLKRSSVDVRMFGGTFGFTKNLKNIYGPIQLTYGVDINNADIKRHNIGSPFSTADSDSGQQKTYGSEYVVDDAIISYDITINPNNYYDDKLCPNLLYESDLELFKKALWYGTNLRKSTSKKTDSKLLILIKFNEQDDGTIINIGELKDLISISNEKEHKNGEKVIKLNCDKLINKLITFGKYIEGIKLYFDSEELILEYNDKEYSNNFEVSKDDITLTFIVEHPVKLLDG